MYFATKNSLYLLIFPEKEIKNLILKTHQSICHKGIDKTEIVKSVIFLAEYETYYTRIHSWMQKLCVLQEQRCWKNWTKTNYHEISLSKVSHRCSWYIVIQYRWISIQICVNDYFSKSCVLIPLKEINSESITSEFF